MSDAVSDLPDAIVTLLSLTDRICGVDLHKGREKVGHGKTINSEIHASANNNSEDHYHNNDKHNRGDDKNNICRHTPHATNKPERVLEKWTISHACTTSDTQSKVYSNGKKKPGGIDDTMLTKQRV